MNVSGTIKVWADERNGKTSYSYSIKVKDEAKYAKQYLHFKGGDPGIENGARIRVNSGFETAYLDKDGRARLGGIVVMDWEPADDPQGDFAALDEIVPF